MDRSLPANLDAERSVLGAILVNASAWNLAASVLRPRDFYRNAHERIFTAIAVLVEAGTPADFVTLCEELRRRGVLDECGGPAYISGLADGIPKATNVEYYARIVKEKARLREVIYAANELLTQAYESDESAALCVDRAVSRLTDAVEAPDSGLTRADDAIREYLTSLDDGSVGAPVCSGLHDLDALTGGFKPGDLVIVGARPSTGKTGLAVGIADHAAATAGPGVFFTLEMSRMAIAARVLGQRAHVPTDRLSKRTATDEHWQRIAHAVETVPVPFEIEETAHTVTEMGAWCRRARQKNGDLKWAVVDYMQMMTGGGSDARDRITGISRGLKTLAKQLKIPVIALSQLSRAPEGRRDKRPQMSDLRESGALEQDADLGILIYRADMYGHSEENDGVAELIVAKHRNGPTGVVRTAFLQDFAQFVNLAQSFDL